MISNPHRCIFVHIPRCAGSSVESMIWPGPRREEELWMGFVDRYRNKYQTGGLQHLLAGQIRKEVGREVFAAYFKFTVVRNPFDRLVSQFAYMSRREDLREFVGMGKDASFAGYLACIRRRSHVQWEPQTSFLVDDDGSLLVDYVVRFESLERDLSQVLARLKMTAAVPPHVNASDRGAYQAYYTAETRAEVEEMYSDDLDRFGYEF